MPIQQVRQVDRAAVVQAARTCMLTPFHHQGRAPGVGLDCIGLVVISGRAGGAKLQDCIDYSPYPDGRTLLREAEVNFDRIPIEDAADGDVMLFRLRAEVPQHVGILDGEDLIHTNASVGWVTKHRYDERWRMRTHSAWRFRA